jgi:hypothetical protein
MYKSHGVYTIIVLYPISVLTYRTCADMIPDTQRMELSNCEQPVSYLYLEINYK